MSEIPSTQGDAGRLFGDLFGKVGKAPPRHARCIVCAGGLFANETDPGICLRCHRAGIARWSAIVWLGALVERWQPPPARPA